MQQLLTKNVAATYNYQNLVKLSKEQTLELLSYLTDRIGKQFIMMGGLLYVIRKNKWYDPYTTFAEFCDASIALQYRKAMYLIQIYESLVDNHIPFNDVSELGYTKLTLLSTHFTADNYKTLIAWAIPLTTQEIDANLKDMAKKSSDFLSKIMGTKVLEATYTETSKTKVSKPDITVLRNLLTVTAVDAVVEALRIMHPDKEFEVLCLV